MDQSNSVYIPKEKAAKKLGLGPRRVLELAKQGLLGKQRVWSDKTHRHQVLISEPDVDSYLARQKEISENGGISPPKNGAAADETALIRMSDQITRIRELPPPPPPGPKYQDWQWLTLEEAAAELRLPERVLQNALRERPGLQAVKASPRSPWYVRWSTVRAYDFASRRAEEDAEREEEVATRGWQP